MKNLVRLAAASALATGIAMMASGPANAGVGISIGVGGYYPPAYYGPTYYGPRHYGPRYYGPAYYGPRYYRGACDYYAPYYDPYACDWPVYSSPVYIGGVWYTGPIRYRNWGGHRWYWVNRGWHRDEWRGPRPAHIRGGVHVGGFHGNGAWRHGGGHHRY